MSVRRIAHKARSLKRVRGRFVPADRLCVPSDWKQVDHKATARLEGGPGSSPVAPTPRALFGAEVKPRGERQNNGFGRGGRHLDPMKTF